LWCCLAGELLCILPLHCIAGDLFVIDYQGSSPFANLPASFLRTNAPQDGKYGFVYGVTLQLEAGVDPVLFIDKNKYTPLGYLGSTPPQCPGSPPIMTLNVSTVTINASTPSPAPSGADSDEKHAGGGQGVNVSTLVLVVVALLMQLAILIISVRVIRILRSVALPQHGDSHARAGTSFVNPVGPASVEMAARSGDKRI
jgi:hypothetical protein